MKPIWIFPCLAFCLAACVFAAPGGIRVTSPQTDTSALTLAPPVTLTLTPTETLTPEPTSSPTPPPPGSSGPSNFPEDVDPLTGLKVADASRLDRRPMIVKVANLPRDYRPQWGLSKADHVFEYYIEEGSTRFAAVFLGQDASMVGPIRSGRFFDNHLIHMYSAIFAFGSADYRVRDLLYSEPYADRLVVESYCPPMCRLLPESVNYLVTNTVDLTTYINHRRVTGGNQRQNLDGLFFSPQTPLEGESISRIFVRYSAAIYNRWDYKPKLGKYFRHSDADNDFENGKNEVYHQLIDRLTGEPISADNLVVLFIPHEYISRIPEIVDIIVSGPGKAYLFRDGQAFELKWYRNGKDQLFNLVDKDGKHFPLKPGNTWFEVVSVTTTLDKTGEAWRFTFSLP